MGKFPALYAHGIASTIVDQFLYIISASMIANRARVDSRPACFAGNVPILPPESIISATIDDLPQRRIAFPGSANEIIFSEHDRRDRSTSLNLTRFGNETCEAIFCTAVAGLWFLRECFKRLRPRDWCGISLNRGRGHGMQANIAR